MSSDHASPPDWAPVDGEFYFLEADPAGPRATLTRVEAWDAGAPAGPRTLGRGGGRTLATRPGYGTPARPETGEAFVAGGDRPGDFPATWSQMFAGSREVPGGGGSRDIRPYLRFLDVEELPAGCRVRAAGDGSAAVLYPDGRLRTIHPHPDA